MSFAGCRRQSGRLAGRRDDAERIDYLAERANDGVLSDEEREEYAGYLHAIDVIAVLQAKARSQLRRQS